MGLWGSLSRGGVKTLVDIFKKQLDKESAGSKTGDSASEGGENTGGIIAGWGKGLSHIYGADDAAKRA